MLIITTINEMPKGCYDNCICNHDGWCYAIHTSDGSEFDYQEAQPVRPYNCPLKLEEELETTKNKIPRGILPPWEEERFKDDLEEE